MELVKNADPQDPSPPIDDQVMVGRCWRHGAVRVTEGAFGFPNVCPICSQTLTPILYQKIVHHVQES